MKRHLAHIMLTAGLAALLGSITLSAQDQDGNCRGSLCLSCH